MRSWGEISTQCITPYGRWLAIWQHPRSLELFGLMTMLICNPQSTMTGLYVLDIGSIASDLRTPALIEELLGIAVELGILRWDPRTHLLYMPGVADDQMHLKDGQIKPADLRFKSVLKHLSVLEQLLGQHAFIKEFRLRYIPFVEWSGFEFSDVGSESSESENNKPLVGFNESKLDSSKTENRRGLKGLARGLQSPTVPCTLYPVLKGEEGGVGGGEDRPFTRSEQGFLIPGNQYYPADGVKGWARDELGLTDQQIQKVTDDYHRKNWVSVRPERLHLLGWRSFAHHLAERLTSQAMAMNSNSNGGLRGRRPKDDGPDSGGRDHSGHPCAESSAPGAPYPANDEARREPRRLSERDAAHRRRSQAYLATLGGKNS